MVTAQDLQTMTTTELTQWRAEVDAELARRQLPPVEVRVTKHFGGYNPRRYSRPWICRVVRWDVGKRPEVEWGRFLGNIGGSGEVEIMARPGDIIRWGQRDNRAAVWKSEREWGIVEADGTVTDCTESQARKAFRATSDGAAKVDADEENAQ